MQSYLIPHHQRMVESCMTYSTTVMQHLLWLQIQINAWNDRSSGFDIPGCESWHILGFPGPTLFDCHQVLAFHSPRCFLVMIFQASALGQFLTDAVIVHFHPTFTHQHCPCILGTVASRNSHPPPVLLGTTRFLLPVPILFVYRFSTFT
jgi:hypothetical protein